MTKPTTLRYVTLHYEDGTLMRDVDVYPRHYVAKPEHPPLTREQIEDVVVVRKVLR